MLSELKNENFREQTYKLDERTLPPYLQESINRWKYKEEKDKLIWDCFYMQLYGDINSAQHDYLITKEDADYLREKYL